MRTVWRYSWRHFSSFTVAACFLGLLLVNGCTFRARVYDSEYHDYHTWNHSEVGYYEQWERDTHREHREFKDRDRDEQNEYWRWRHNHRDQDRDH